MNKSTLITAFGLFAVIVLAMMAHTRIERKIEAARVKRMAEQAAAAAAAAAPDTDAQ